MEHNAYSPGPASSSPWKDGCRAPRPAALRKVWAALLALFLLAPAAESLAQTTYGKGLPTNAPAAGTYMGYIPNGARISAFHRGYIFLPQSDANAGCTVWDISNIASPVRVASGTGGGNGHMWVKMGDLFWRQYAVGEVPAGTNADFLDFSKLPNLAGWTTPMSFPITGRSVNPQLFPLNYNEGNHTITDARNGQVLSTNNLNLASGVTGRDNKWRIGNLILFTPGDGQSGMAIFDAGDPKNIRLLDNYTGNLKQYSTAFQVWRNYVVLMTGDNSNGPSGTANVVGIDISNPSDIRVAFEIPGSILGSRYVFFQDEFGFSGGFNNYKKVNMETRTVVQEFSVPSNRLSNDFQAIPLGHVLMTTGDGYHTNFFAHQTGLDRRAPTVGFHWPKANATNLPVSSVLGFVINETLMSETVNDVNIQVRPASGGVNVAADVTSFQNGVVNFAPRQPLAVNTTYEVTFVAGGIKDVAGNGMAEYKFLFSTGSTIATNNPPTISNVAMAPASPVNTGTAVTFTATATDPNGDALSYRWDFGDGSPQTAFSTSNAAAKTYANAGNYTVLLQVSDGKGEITSSTKSLVVVNPVSGPLPTRSSSIVVDNAGRKVWVVNSDNDNVAAINADNLTVVHNVAVGKRPTGVAVDGSAQVWVTCREEDKVYILSKSTGALVGTLSLARGAQPAGIVFTPDGTTGYIAEYGTGRVTRVSAASRTVTGSLSVGPTPTALAITGDASKLLVSRFISGSGGGSVYQVNLGTFTAGPPINLPLDNTTADTEVAGRGLPNYVAGLALSPSSAQAWYVAKKDNILRGLARDGATPTFETTVRFLAAPLNVSTGTEITASRKDIDNHAQPSSITFSPQGNHLFLTEQGNNRLLVLNASNGQEITRADVGKAPQGVAVDPTTNRVFTENFMSRSVTVYNASSMLTQGTTTLGTPTTISIVTTEKLTASVLKGKQLFYEAADPRIGKDGYISCASCHLDGREDGRNWDFTHRGEGIRNTIALRGRAGTGQGRVHWSANFDEVQDFENDIRSHFSGTGLMSNAAFNTGTRANPLGDAKAGASADLDALAAYLQSLDTFDPSPFRNGDGTLTAEGAAGKVLFGNLGCGSCHSGASFTNSASGLLHDVGTIKTASGKRSNAALLGIDVPTLRDVWQTAPYLHDGSAATLRDVLTTQNATGRHGATATLTTGQVDQLVAYLQQIDGSEPAAAASLALTLSSPAAAASYAEGAAVPLGITTAGLANITEVRYYANGNQVASATASPFSASWTAAGSGTIDLQAKVFHDGGRASVSRETKITVQSAAPVKLTGTYFGTTAWTGCTTCTFDKAFDGNTATYFDANDANGAYAGMDAGTARVVTRIRYYPRASDPGRMVGGKFQGSNTSSSTGYVDLYTIPGQPTVAWQEVNLTGTTAYRYIRYLSPAGGYGNVAELEFYAGGVTDAQAPTVPTALASSNVTSSSFTLTWTASSDNVGVTGYDVYRGTTLAGSSTTTSFNVTGLSASTAYAMTVRAKDAAGNASAASTALTVTTSAAPVAGTNLALNKPTVTSTTEGTTFTGAQAVDGSATTRWASVQGVDPQWLQVDLGASYSISRVVLSWEAAYASGYSIQVSGDATNWTSIYSTTTGNGALDDLTGLSGTGRYIRMFGTARGTAWGYSLWEFEVYGTAAGTTTYLSDLTWVSATNGHGPVEKDKSNGEAVAGDGRTLTLNGVTYAKGLGVHAASEVVYNLSGAYSTFLSDVGIDDWVADGTCGSAVFEVYLDNVLAYSSGTMTPTSATKSINLGVAGKNQLKLVVTIAGDNNFCDHADWAGARLTSGGARIAAETATDAGLCVYPNPARGTLTVDLEAGADQPVSLSFINQLSQPVGSFQRLAQKGRNSFRLDVSAYPEGMYFLVVTRDGTRTVRKVVIKK